jgi:MIP family channel proteins
MNPAVSLSMLIMGKLSVAKFFIYLIGQCIGALLGSVMVYVVYLDALNAFDGGIRQIDGPNGTAGIFGTYPAGYLSTSGAFFDQFFATTLLITCILAIGDSSNSDISFGTKALLNGNVVFIIGLSFGANCGYAINPVRDLIPRLFTSFSGWGLDVFRSGNYYFWIPIFGPLCGSLFATFLYAFMIGNHWPNEKSDLN